MSETTPRRRRSLLLPLTVGIDIGGTKILGGVTDLDGTILAFERRVTMGRDIDAVEDTIVDLVRGFAGDFPIAAVGIGAAGFIDASRSVVMFAPHLDWRREPLRERVADRVRLPVVVDNDANAAALGECRYGAGRGHRFVLCATLGTGIGGALVMDGKVFRGANGMAGEFGHFPVVPNGHRCECGNRGCWEQYASGNALTRDARELVAARSPAAHHLSQLVAGDALTLDGPQITQAALDGDALSMELLHEVGTWLGVGLAGMAGAFDPGCIVVGGGLSSAGDLLLKPARASFARTLTGRGFRESPLILQATLGPDAGFIGAAEMARSAARRSLRRSRPDRDPLRAGRLRRRVRTLE